MQNDRPFHAGKRLQAAGGTACQVEIGKFGVVKTGLGTMFDFRLNMCKNSVNVCCYSVFFRKFAQSYENSYIFI